MMSPLQPTHVAVNGVVDGHRLWIEEEPWWTNIPTAPLRPEDGMLDWAALAEDQRQAVRRVDAAVRRACGIVAPPPRVPAPTPGRPCPQGWRMSIRTLRGLLERDGTVTSVDVLDKHEVIGTDQYALALRVGDERWLARRHDGQAWTRSRQAAYAWVPSVWVGIVMWRHPGYLEMGQPVEQPGTVVSARLRTIRVDDWPDDEHLFGARPGAGPDPQVHTPVVWDGASLWWSSDRSLHGPHPRWWEGVFPAGGDGRADIDAMTDAETAAYRAVEVYRGRIRFWDDPVGRVSRSRERRWRSPIGPAWPGEDAPGGYWDRARRADAAESGGSDARSQEDS